MIQYQNFNDLMRISMRHTYVQWLSCEKARKVAKPDQRARHEFSHMEGTTYIYTVIPDEFRVRDGL